MPSRKRRARNSVDKGCSSRGFSRISPNYAQWYPHNLGIFHNQIAIDPIVKGYPMCVSSNLAFMEYYFFNRRHFITIKVGTDKVPSIVFFD
jgi:hypothetical protein